MRFARANDVSEILYQLQRDYGLLSLEVTYGDELEDPDADFGLGVSLQIGGTYVSVNVWNEPEGTMGHHHVATTAEAAKVLRTVLAEAKERLANLSSTAEPAIPPPKP